MPLSRGSRAPSGSVAGSSGAERRPMCVPFVQESAKLLSVFTAFATCPPLLRCRQGLALPSPGTPRKEEEDHFLGTDAAKTDFWSIMGFSVVQMDC